MGASLPAQHLARFLLTGGPCGMKLYGELWQQFPKTDRDSVYLAVALAWTEMQAALLAVEAEIQALRPREAA